MNKIIDVPEIHRQLKQKHKKFLKEVAGFSHKISNDHQLLLAKAVARMSRILECFVEEGILDEATQCKLPYSDNEYTRTFHLKKNGFTRSIYLWTDGNSFAIGSGRINIVSEGVEYYPNFNTGDDGIAFANILLDSIHRDIYARVQSYEQKIFDKLASPKKEDTNA